MQPFNPNGNDRINICFENMIFNISCRRGFYVFTGRKFFCRILKSGIVFLWRSFLENGIDFQLFNKKSRSICACDLFEQGNFFPNHGTGHCSLDFLNNSIFFVRFGNQAFIKLKNFGKISGRLLEFVRVFISNPHVEIRFRQVRDVADRIIKSGIYFL